MYDETMYSDLPRACWAIITRPDCANWILQFWYLRNSEMGRACTHR